MCVYIYIYVCIYMYIYIYIYTHTHTHTQLIFNEGAKAVIQGKDSLFTNGTETSQIFFLIYFYLFTCLHLILVAASRIFSCSLWDLVPWPGIKWGPLHWENRVLATGPTGKSHSQIVLMKKKWTLNPCMTVYLKINLRCIIYLNSVK